MTVVPEESVVAAVTGETDVSDGGVVSVTVTVRLAETGSLFSSVAVHVTSVEPSGKFPVTSKSPEPPVPGGVHVAAIGLPVSGSYAFTWNVTLAPDGLVASAVASLTRIAGGAPPLVDASINTAKTLTNVMVRRGRSLIARDP